MQKSTFPGQSTSVFTSVAAETARNGFMAALINRVANWLRRSKLNSLEHLEDHMLTDIGITRQDLGWARDLPLNRNPLAALDDLTRHRACVRHLTGIRALPGSKIR